MNKAMPYIVLALFLGLLLILVPTWFFLVKADEQGTHTMVFTRQLPLIDYAERNHIETLSFKEVEVLGISFVIALVVFVLFKRRSSNDYSLGLHHVPTKLLHHCSEKIDNSVYFCARALSALRA